MDFFNSFIACVGLRGNPTSTDQIRDNEKGAGKDFEESVLFDNGMNIQDAARADEAFEESTDSEEQNEEKLDTEDSISNDFLDLYLEREKSTVIN